ncbi:D-alanyl-D-alanine carboxypeptidase [Magnetospirillum fulvum MGU-K5]|uniref:D-alanyl-D-alanine carboxypeptidase n=1 Tax=Magnetospirillum fulvum MGU-K5 TaxID=1316936 RepID=S9TGM7_MAGFU|nr:D-alanyl-D-alanine carboxypeptidase [Magnetospirillum fulvum MGU-K5]
MQSRRQGAFPFLRPALLGLVAIFLLAASPAWAGKYASIVIDAGSGKVLHAANPDVRSYPASLTKVMTLFLLFDELESGRMHLDTMLPVSAHAAAQAPSKLGLRPGETISVRDVILALVTKSANDAAVVAAEGIGGTESEFAQMMTRKAQTLGMNRTVYRNASGLPNPGQMSTVRDQAVLARALINRHAGPYHYFSTRQFVWKGQTISTHNRLMLRYPGADGIKTGYIQASGFNLISSARRDDQRIIGVVFGGTSGTSRDNHMKELLDRGFARIKSGETVEVAAAPSADDRSDLDDLVAAAHAAGAAGVAKAAAAKPTKAQAKAHAKAVKTAHAKVTKTAHFKVAAAKPAHGKARKGREDMGDSDLSSWTIQVGAFKDYRPAQQAAAQAARTLGHLAAKGSIDINKMKGHKPMYRARLAGLNESQARAACKRLGKAGQSCKLIGPDI